MKIIRVSKISFVVIVLILNGCRPLEPSATEENKERVPAMHIAYGAPVGVEVALPVAWALPTEVSEEEMKALNAMPIVSMAISEAVFQNRDWEESVKNIDSYFEGPNTPSKLIKGYIIDQMVVQYMLTYSDILDSPGSNRRTAKLREYLTILTTNRFPFPERVESILLALGEEISSEDSAVAARLALEAHEYLSHKISIVKEGCLECYESMTVGENPEEVQLRTNAINNLKAMAKQIKN